MMVYIYCITLKSMIEEAAFVEIMSRLKNHSQEHDPNDNSAYYKPIS